MRKKTKNRHGAFGLQVLMLLFLLLVGANGAYAQSDCFEYEENVITGLTETGRAASSLTIPATVTIVRSGAFSSAAYVSTLIIEAGGNPTFEGKLFGDDKTNPISDIQILGNSMTVANIQKLFTSLGAQGALSTVYIAGYSGEWQEDITSNAVLTSEVTVTLPAALVRAQKFGDATVCGRFEITKEIISFCGNATFQDTDDGSNMLFYIADECNKEEGYIHIQRVSYVKKGEGVLIHNLKNTSAYADLPVYDGEITGDDATNYNKNMLKGVTTATTIGKTDGDKTNLVLKDGAFHPTLGGTIGANKAYLQVPTTGAMAARKILNISFYEEATAIRLTTSATRDEGEWYDLSGRLLNSRPSAKGLYIYNGKKYVIR
ncbi:MAG: hypothetical protein IJ901_08500 [Bacteroidaceae bacterium]|nr:hypothetical protein [Bacteroidaceae bacterium]